MEEKIKQKRNALKFKMLTQDESYSIILFLLLAIISAGRGVVFLNLSYQQIRDAEFYTALDSSMPLWIYGTTLIFFSVTMFVSVFLKRKLVGTIVMLISNLALGFIFAILSAAAIGNTATFWTVYLHTILSITHLTLGGMGVYWYWLTSTKTKT